MAFEYAHIEAYPNWALDGPKLYFMGKDLLEFDSETLIRFLPYFVLICLLNPGKDRMKEYFTASGKFKHKYQ